MAEYKNENVTYDEQSWRGFYDALSSLADNDIYKLAQCDEVDERFSDLYEAIMKHGSERAGWVFDTSEEEKPRLRETVGTVTVDVRVDFSPMIDDLEAMAKALREIQAKYGE